MYDFLLSKLRFSVSKFSDVVEEDDGKWRKKISDLRIFNFLLHFHYNGIYPFSEKLSNVVIPPSMKILAPVI